MKTIATLVILVVLVCNNISAQYYTNQNKKWTFGAYAGLDFTSGTPVPFSTSLQTQEGSASVADASGNLLFYTDGKTIWDKTGNIMPSGSSIVPYITNSTTQGAVIVPTLNNANQYYVFSLEQAQATPTTTSHLAYSIVDITLHGGLGDAITSSGTLMDSFLSEKMIAIPGNNCNIWLLVHKLNAPVFRAYEITAAGINFTPVVSTVGSFSGLARGVIKVSPNRQKIASANSTVNAELYDFDPNTGVVSNSNQLNIANCYGAEFSPDNTKLYLSNSSSPIGVFQYDITLPTISSIVASQYTVTTATACYDLKLAADNKIYIASYGSGSLDCISAPNLSGSACNFTHPAVSLAPGSCYLGFPNLFWSVSLPSRITGDTILCQGASTTLSDTSPGGTWTSSNTAVATINAATGYFTTGLTGTSIIAYTTSCGAVTTTVTVNANPAVISGAMAICNNATTTLSDAATGGTWSSSNTDVSIASAGSSGNAVVTGTATGISIITYSLPGGCIATTTVTINPTPSPITGATIICAGAATQLSNAISGGTWSVASSSIATISATGLVTGTTPGTDVISYSTGSGCTVTTSIIVTAPPSAITGIKNICLGSTTTLSDATTGGTWSSSNTNIATAAPGASGEIITSVSSGISTIIYSLPGGCMATTTVTVAPSPSAITGNTTVCAGSTTQLSDAISGGTWSWGIGSASAGIIALSATGKVTGVNAGVAVVSYSTGSGCIVTTSVTVIAFGTSAILSPFPVCLEVTGTITFSDATPGGVWSSAATGIATISAGGTITALSAGIDTISYTVTTSCGPATASNIITVLGIPGKIMGDTVVCNGSSIALSDTSAGVWQSFTPDVAAITSTGILTGLSAGTAYIVYFLANSCEDTITINITVIPSPPISPITGQNTICQNIIFTLSDATPGGVWSSSNVVIASIDSSGTVSVFTQGADTASTATISYTTGPSANGCYSTDTFVLHISAQGTFAVDSTVIPVKCFGGSDGSINVVINGGTQSVQYLWGNGVAGTDLTDRPVGYDTLYIKDEFTQCSDELLFYVPGPAAPLQATATAKNDTCYDGKGSIIAAPTGGTAPYTYLWSNNKTGKEITGLKPGTYSVTITDSNNCTTGTSDTVNEDTCSNIIIHDVITPNGDGLNDTWVIESIQGYPASIVQVYDKWGDMVYEKTNYQNDWNGKGKSGLLPDGTYYYLVKLNAPASGGQNTFTGALLIKR